MVKLPWLQGQIKQWQQLVDSQQVPHAILLNSAKGLGKFELAKHMAHIALCEDLSQDGFCGRCSACELFKVGNHPDFTLISAEKNTIKVEQIRKLSKDIRLSATKGQYRAVVVENAEQMNKAAANALLKTLEEPPNKVVLILTTSEMGRLLPTIKSRCVKMNIAVPNHTESIAWLGSLSNKSEAEIVTSLALANYSPLVAKSIIQEGSLSHVKQMLADLESLINSQKTVLEVSKAWFSEELFVHLPLMASYFVNLVKHNNQLVTSNHVQYLNFQFDFSQIHDLNRKILEFIRNIYRFNFRSETALKKELLIEELLINWKSDFK
ncbi:MAG: DNA polymerase III subunit delta' [Proteobacteria bacterium]|nr:DNA polymerase III subunit delta' [Pseudomonadota bacterium]